MRRKMHPIKWILLFIFMAASVLIFVGPMLWMISLAFRPESEALASPPTLFKGMTFTLQAFPAFLQSVNFFRIFGNSVFVTGAITLTATFTSVLAGFAFAKYDFKGKNLIFMGMIATVMIPIFVLIVPLYLMIDTLHWLNTYKALIIPFMGSAFGIFFMRQSIYAVPDDLLYASRIDGCSEFGIFLRMIIPTTIPAISSLAILTFMAQWDSLLWPLIVANKTNMQLLPVAISNIATEGIATARWNIVMAATLMSTAPILVAYLFLQRYFIGSITMTGFKD